MRGSSRRILKTGVDRSAIMRAVKSRNTAPELAVRKLLTLMGYRDTACIREACPECPILFFRPAKK